MMGSIQPQLQIQAVVRHMRLPIAGSILCKVGIGVTSMLRSHIVLTELELAFVFGILKVHLSWQKLSAFHVFTRLMLVKHWGYIVLCNG